MFGIPQHELERVISRFGEERFARRITRSIIAHRPIENTEELADIVKDAIPAATRRTGSHPAACPRTSGTAVRSFS